MTTLSSRTFSVLVGGLVVLATGVPAAGAPPADRTGPDRLWTLAPDQVTPIAAVEGSAATVVRTDGGIAYQVRTTGLAPGHADTLWVMVFNHPDLCQHPVPATGARCGVADLVVFGGDPAIGSSVLYGGGHVVGGVGAATFAGSLRIGDTDGALFGPDNMK